MSWHAQVGDGQYLDGWELVYILNLLDSRICNLREDLPCSPEIEYANNVRNKLEMSTLGETLPMKLEIKT